MSSSQLLTNVHVWATFCATLSMCERRWCFFSCEIGTGFNSRFSVCVSVEGEIGTSFNPFFFCSRKSRFRASVFSRLRRCCAFACSDVLIISAAHCATDANRHFVSSAALCASLCRLTVQSGTLRGPLCQLCIVCRNRVDFSRS